MSDIENQSSPLTLDEWRTADVVTRARHAIDFGNSDGLHRELVAEVEKLRGAIETIKRKAEIGHSQTSIPSDERMMSLARNRFANILNVIQRIEKNP